MNATVARVGRHIDLATGVLPAALLRRALRRPDHRFEDIEAADIRAVIATAREHRVLVLLGTELRRAGTLGQWPSEFQKAFTLAEHDAAALDCIRHLELRRVLDAAGGAGVRTLVFKGAALAYTHYHAPHVRARADTDLLIDNADSVALEDTLCKLGYRRQHETSGHLVSHQSHYGRFDRHGVFHALDVHWKISNRHAFADRIRFEELWANRIALPVLGPSAMRVSDVHALLLALVHRAGHHPGSSNLLWIYDVHALASRMSDRELEDLAQLANARGLAAPARDGLWLAHDWFGTPRLDSPIRIVTETSRYGDAARVLPDRWRQAGVVGHDLRALPTWSARGRLIREHLFPSPAYIRGKYGVRSSLLLPALYAWRIVAGAPRWLRRYDEGG